MSLSSCMHNRPIGRIQTAHKVHSGTVDAHNLPSPCSDLGAVMLCFGHLLGLGLATFSFTGEPCCTEVPVRAERLTAEAVTDSS